VCTCWMPRSLLRRPLPQLLVETAGLTASQLGPASESAERRRVPRLWLPRSICLLSGPECGRDSKPCRIPWSASLESALPAEFSKETAPTLRLACRGHLQQEEATIEARGAEHRGPPVGRADHRNSGRRTTMRQGSTNPPNVPAPPRASRKTTKAVATASRISPSRAVSCSHITARHRNR